MAGRTGCPPFSHCLSYPFIRAFILSPTSTYKLAFLGLKTCPVSPYLEWLGVIAKAEEHGSVRCRVLNGSNGNFPFVLGRYTIHHLLLYWHKYFRFFSQIVPIPFLPFLPGGPRICRGQNHPRLCLKTIWTFNTHPRLYPSSARALGPNVKMGQGHKLLGPTIILYKT